MQSSVLQGILLPFWGTSLGAACVFCLRRAPSAVLRRVLEGFAAGVMTAASVWSLLLPAIDWADMGRWSFLPAAGGFWLGVLFLRLLERLLPEAVTDRSTTMTLLAVTLHNIPEGMAVGAAYAGCVAAGAAAPAAAFTLALAIAIQNVPEGAIVALPPAYRRCGKRESLLGGVLSGVVEPLAAERDGAGGGAHRSGTALAAGLCRRGHALCGGRRAAAYARRPRPGGAGLCRGLYRNDDPGRGIGVGRRVDNGQFL